MTFAVRDSEGVVIHIKDIVSYTTQGLMDAVTGDAIVVGLLPDNMVEIQPILGGVPITLEGGRTSIKESLISAIESLSTYEEFQALMLDTENRFKVEKAQAKATKRAVKAKDGAPTKAKKDTTASLEIDI